MLFSLLPTKLDGTSLFDGEVEIRGDFLVAFSHTTDEGGTLAYSATALRAIDSLSVDYVVARECSEHAADRNLARLRWRVGGEGFTVIISRTCADSIVRWHRVSLNRVSQ